VDCHVKRGLLVEHLKETSLGVALFDPLKETILWLTFSLLPASKHKVLAFSPEHLEWRHKLQVYSATRRWPSPPPVLSNLFPFVLKRTSSLYMLKSCFIKRPGLKYIYKKIKELKYLLVSLKAEIRIIKWEWRDREVKPLQSVQPARLWKNMRIITPNVILGQLNAVGRIHKLST